MVLAQDVVVWMVPPSVVAFVKYQKGDLFDGPQSVSEEVKEDLSC